MLADAVEAASRTLKKPTEEKLDAFVWNIIMEKFHSGELGESNLAMRDLEIIRRSFRRVLEGYFHTRIEYPKLKDKGAATASLAPSPEENRHERRRQSRFEAFVGRRGRIGSAVSS